MDILAIDPKKEQKNIIVFLQAILKKTCFSKYIVAVSGGIDSAVVTSLAVKAIGSENLRILLLPCGDLNKDGLQRARILIDKLHIPEKNRKTINIENVVNEITKTLNGSVDSIRMGNIMARVRMTILFDQAKDEKALVVGTENKSEHLLGYFTRFGDEASDIEPIIHLYKTQVLKLSEYVGIPKEIRSAKPTAGLWEGQTDEEELGFSYKDADQILTMVYDQNMKEEEIKKKGIQLETMQKVLKRVKDNEFKQALPYSPISIQR